MKLYRIINALLALIYILVSCAFLGFCVGIAVNVFEWVVK